MIRKLTISFLLAAMLAGCGPTSAGEAAGVSGEFSGTAKGNGGDVTVTLTFKDGKITGVTGVGDQETPGIGDEALAKMIDQMAGSGSISADMVSGATVTSTAVKEAALAALKEAGVDPSQYGG